MLMAKGKDEIGTGLIAFCWALFPFSFVIVSLRVWTRVGYLKDRMQIHDWLMLGALLVEIIHAALLTAAREAGMGYHIYNLEPKDIGQVGHYINAIESFSVIVSYLGRMSFAAFLLSVIGAQSKIERWFLWAMIVSDSFINLFVVIQTYADCGTHLSANWDPAVAAIAHCQPATFATYLGYFQASLNSFCDLALTILPITIIRKLQMPMGTKIGLGALLMLSIFAFVASVAKAVEIRQLSNGPDFTYNFAVLQYCVVGENNTVMIAASIPMLRALFIKDKGGNQKSNYHSGSQGNKSGAVVSRKTGTHVTATKIEDDEEMMLGDMPKQGGITRTVGTVVTATYADGRKDPDVSVDAASFKTGSS